MRFFVKLMKNNLHCSTILFSILAKIGYMFFICMLASATCGKAAAAMNDCDLDASVAFTNIGCYGANDGTITVSEPTGGSGSYEYRLDTGIWQASGEFTGLAPASYSVQIRDAANTDCVITLDASLQITEPAALTADVASTNITCFGADDGSITITNPSGGYGTYEYRLDAGTWQASGEFTGLAPASYSVQIRDAANTDCVITLNASLQITEPAALTADVASTNITCFGADDGTITITNPSGGYGTYEYSIDGGTNWQASGTFTGLPPATCNVQIRDAANPACVIILNASLQITEPDALTADVASTNITCFGADDGTITVSNPAGGYGTYEYSIDGGTNWQAGGTFTGLPPATCNVQIRDAANTDCVITLNASLQITEPDALTADVAHTDVTCVGFDNGTITVSNPAGGHGTYEASIGDGWFAFTTATPYTFENLEAGLYSVEIRDADNEDCVVIVSENLEIAVIPDTEDPEISCVDNQEEDTDPGDCTYTHSGTGWDATATDNCEVASVTYELTGATTGTGTSLDGVTFNAGETTITWTATDTSDNTADCSFTVTVEDNEPPTITCPEDIAENTQGGSCHRNINPPAPAYDDNCAIESITWEMTGASTGSGTGHMGNTTFYAGVTEVTYTVTDTSGNAESCSFTVTITDNVPPEITCPADIQQTADPGRCYATLSPADLGEPAVSDNCTPEEDILVSNNFAALFPNGQVPVGTHIITWTAEDASGNTATCEQEITVTDDEPPTFTPPSDITIYVDANCEYDASVPFTGNVTNVSDNCTPSGDISVSYSDAIEDGECPGTYIITRTWSVADANGNEATHDQTITVADNRPPSITVPPTIQIECDQDPDDLSLTGEATGSNVCGGEVDIDYSDEIFPRPCPTEYDIIRTWVATDCSGNTRTGEQTIRVRDTTPPAVEELPTLYVPCPEDVPEPDSTMVVAIDNCGPVTARFHKEIAYGLDNQPGYCPDSLDHVYRVTDLCGNFTDVTHRIVVLDDCGCSPCDGDDSFFTVDLIGQPSGSITLENIQRNDLCCDVTRPWRCASFNIRIDDNAVGVEISVDGATPQPMDWDVDCEAAPLVDGNIICIPGGEFYLFTYCKPGGDRNDFTFQSIPGIIVDSEIFTRVSCNTELFAEGDVTNPVWNSVYPGGPGEYNHYLSCLECHDPVFFPDDNAPGEIHYEVCGELAEGPCTDETGIGCSTVRIYILGEIEVEFNVDPGAYCEDEIPLIETTVYPTEGDYLFAWFDGPDATGNIVGTEPNFQPPSAGEYSLRIQDVDEGVLCSELIYNFTVAPDDTPPDVFPPDDLVLECNDPANPQLIANWRAEVWATDDHTAEQHLIIWDDYAGIDQFCDNELVVTFFAEDECGNIGEATASIIIIDTQAPTWATPEGDLNRTIECSDLDALADAMALEPVATDACDDDATLVPVKTEGEFESGIDDCDTEGTITNTWVVTDDCFNTSEVYTQVITITDNTPPVIDPPASDMEVECDGEGNTAELNEWLNNQGGALATDPCGGPVTWTNDFTELTDDCGNTGEATVTFTATDDCDNTASTTATFTIVDTQPPVLITPAPDIEVGPDPETCEVDLEDVDLIPPVFTDVCDDENITLTNDAPDVFPPGETIVTWTATDDCGNTETTTQTVTVWTLEPPDVECPPDSLTVSTDEGVCEAFVNVPAPDVTDPCPYTMTHDSEYGISDEDASGTYPVGSHTIIWTITDIFDNVTTCLVVLTVVDDEDPELICPDPIEQEADWGEDFASDVEVPPPFYDDNCEVVTLTWEMTGATTGSSPAEGINILEVDTFYVGVTTIEYTAVDSSGNITTCTFTVTIFARPVIECPDDIIVDADEGECISSLNPGIPTLIQGSQPIEWTWTLTNPDGTELTGGSTSTDENPLPEHIVPEPPHEYDFQVGTTTILWTATNDSGEDSCVQTITVIDDQPPTFDTHGPFEFCVFDLFLAWYNGMPEPEADIDPDRPDYYTIDGTNELDISNIQDNCCELENMTIHWEIQYDPETGQPPLEGTGQPSAYGEIQLWGTPENIPVTHTITYWVVDCNGNSSEEVTEEITVLPRPHVIKMNE